MCGKAVLLDVVVPFVGVGVGVVVTFVGFVGSAVVDVVGAFVVVLIVVGAVVVVLVVELVVLELVVIELVIEGVVELIVFGGTAVVTLSIFPVSFNCCTGLGGTTAVSFTVPSDFSPVHTKKPLHSLFCKCLVPIVMSKRKLVTTFLERGFELSNNYV